MEIIQDYKILDKRIETKYTVLYTGLKEGSPNPVVVKVLKKHFPTSYNVSRFRQEYKKIMEIHGGSIEVNSRVGEGTDFIINLPIVIVLTT